MKFIEMTGRTLARIIADGETKLDLTASQVDDETIVRVNQHGDIEVRRTKEWDVIGGLIGDFDAKVKKETGREWA